MWPPAKYIGTKESVNVATKEKRSTPTGLVRDTKLGCQHIIIIGTPTEQMLCHVKMVYDYEFLT